MVGWSVVGATGWWLVVGVHLIIWSVGMWSVVGGWLVGVLGKPFLNKGNTGI